MRETGVPGSAPRLLPRIGYLTALFIAELVILSIWFDTGVLAGGHGLAELVSRWGAWTVRSAVAVALGSIIFGESRAKNQLERISDQVAHHSIAWRLLGAHFAAILAFCGLSWMLFVHRPDGTLTNLLIATWFGTGMLAIALAATAFVPSTLWLRIVRSTGDAWIYVLAAGVVASVLGEFAWRFWTPLARIAFSVVEAMLRPFVHVVANPATLSLGTPTFQVEIAPECSGYEGIGLVLAFGTAWLWFLRREWRFPQALLLLPVGVAAIWVLNAVRIAALILIGNAGAVRIALGGFHSQAGWIAFNAVALGLCVGARRVPGFTRQDRIKPRLTAQLEVGTTDVAVRGRNPVPAYLAPFLAILAATMLSRSLTGDFEWFYPLRVAAVLVALWIFRRTYRDLNWRFGWLGVGIGAVVFVLWIALDRVAGPGAGGKDLTAGFFQAPKTAQIAWLVVRITGTVLTVPIAEELAFRGFLQRRLASVDFESVDWRRFSWLPFLVSSIAFGLLHGERWLAGTIAGMFYALAVLRRGRIGEAVGAHATTNALLAAWVLATGKWGLW